MCDIEGNSLAKNAHKILYLSNFDTSFIVSKELMHIESVRTKLYTAIIGQKLDNAKNIEALQNWALNEYSNSKNLPSHILNIFRELENITSIKKTVSLDQAMREKIREEFHIMTRVSLLKLKTWNTRLGKPDYRREHVPYIPTKDPKFANLESELFNVIKPKREDYTDLNIVAHCVFTAYERNVSYVFVSQDLKFHIKNKSKILDVVFRRYHPGEKEFSTSTCKMDILPLGDIS